MSIIGIVAIDKNNAIGKDGRLPWHYSADMKFFKEQTIGNACVMGRRTWESLKKPLPERLNVILSHSSDFEVQPPVMLLQDRPSVLSLAAALQSNVFIIGGAQVYRTFLEDMDKWIVTEVPLEVEGADAFMPDDFLRGFKSNDQRMLDEHLKVTFYERDNQFPK